ncbi:lysoplasmalogenase [Rhodococcus sp. IEGM 1379]|uniref:lysoplasmalogenase n=1 Tax=Rhodococcus sp. IEGM 1379 TaxID=3047086 RepID=UPI0024B65A24|nr:lysoplasmalogenase [Rhodococcus sp. IEGM 1379]MDI9915262.1 lysoplasmalogenase [Rhodococcus sp. IEGM 1379]
MTKDMSLDNRSNRIFDTMRSPWFIAFATVAVAHLILNAADASPWDGITKVMLAPLLAAWVIADRGPRIVAAALIACAFGDLFLIWDGTFIVGMAAFAIGHICFIRFFISRGALAEVRRNPWVLIAYTAAAIALVCYTWSGLGDLTIPVPIYAAILVGTAATSLTYNKIAGVGGALFLASDAMILLGQADKWRPEPADIWIMTTYVLALLLLTIGILSRERQTSTG